MTQRRRARARAGRSVAWLCMVPGLLSGNALAGCNVELLRELGWQVQLGDRAQPEVAAGNPCQRGSLAEAHAQGELQVRLPAGYDEERREQLAARLLQQPASRCAFAFKLGAAARRASARLQANPGYRFTAVQLGWIGFGARGANAQGWQRFRSFGRGYAPVAGNARALEAFYSGRVRSECGVGRQVAQLATLRELFGDAAFDTDFTAGELSIGTFLTLHDTESILLGSSAGEFFADGKAVRTAALGRQAFMAVPGFIAHVFDRQYLDDINNQAENFIITDLSEAATQALAHRGGLAWYDARNRQIWELARQLPPQGRRGFKRLLYERDAALRQALPEPQRGIVARIDSLLADPVYRQLMVYVHRQEVKPLGYHVVRLLDRNPRTPFAIDLALHNLHTTIYQRWLGSRLQGCAAATASTIKRGEPWNWG